MSVWSMLLRVLLSVALILNGSGYAVASTHMSKAVAGAMPTTHDQAHEDASQPPCHGDHAAMVASQHHDTGRTMNHGSSSGETFAMASSAKTHPSKDHPDCCKSGACRCACNHASTPAMAVALVRDALIVRDSASRPLKSGRPAPALPHLIRPPIG